MSARAGIPHGHTLSGGLTPLTVPPREVPIKKTVNVHHCLPATCEATRGPAPPCPTTACLPPARPPTDPPPLAPTCSPTCSAPPSRVALPRLVTLVQDVYVARAEGELQLEAELFNTLISCYRRPALLFELSRKAKKA